MKRVDGVVGNVDRDPALADAVAEHEAAGTLETIVLDDTERRRSRLRVTTDSGTDLGVLVDQPELAAGDVLVLDDDRAVVVAFEEREAFVVEFPAAEAAVATGVELGHRIGNQHWDIAVEGERIYLPVDADRAIIENVLGPYIPEGATTHYETVDAERFVDGGDPDSEHSHGDHDNHDHTDSHSHGDGDHDHTHDHDHDHDHSHNGSPTATPSEGELQ
jgi:urease accessory protein